MCCFLKAVRLDDINTNMLLRTRRVKDDEELISSLNCAHFHFQSEGARRERECCFPTPYRWLPALSFFPGCWNNRRFLVDH